MIVATRTKFYKIGTTIYKLNFSSTYININDEKYMKVITKILILNFTSKHEEKFIRSTLFFPEIGQ